MKIDIPSSCPSCDEKMYSVSYESSLSLLKKRSWQVCKECNFERNSEDFKKATVAHNNFVQFSKQFLIRLRYNK